MIVMGSCLFQECIFSDFSIISDFSFLTPLKIILKIPFLEHVSHDFIIGSNFFRIISDFLIEPDLHPCSLLFPFSFSFFFFFRYFVHV